MSASKLVAFVNSKGGVGKSTIAVHYAVAERERGRRVALIDSDVQESSARWLKELADGEACARKGFEWRREDLDFASKLIYFSRHSTLKNRSMKITAVENHSAEGTYRVTAWYSDEDGHQDVSKAKSAGGGDFAGTGSRFFFVAIAWNANKQPVTIARR